MSSFKKFLGLALAVLMAFSGVAGAFASGVNEPAEAEAAKQPAPEEPALTEIEEPAVTADRQKGDVYFDPLYLISLTEAANPYDALRPVPIDPAASTWKVSRTASQTGRAVACASIPTTSGTYVSTLVTEVMNVCLGNAYMSWSGYVNTDNDASLTVRCTNTDTGATWIPFTNRFLSDIWYDYSCTLSTNASGISYTAYYPIKVEFIYSFTVSSKGGDESGPKCMITDLQIDDTSSMDSVLNAASSDLHFEALAENDVDPFCSYAYPYVARSFVMLRSNSNDSAVCAVTAHVVAAKDDVLSFEYVSDLDYMAGAAFCFGTGTSVNDMQVIYSGSDEGGDGQLWYDWASYEYTIPASGEYDFIWLLDTWGTSDSYVYLDNVRMDPRMSRERILELDYLPSYDATYVDGEDTPWYPVYYRGEFCMRSGNITHNQTSTMISEHNLLKKGDWFQFRLWMSSEANYDFLKVYVINEQTGESSEHYSESGIYTGWIAFGSVMQEDGYYTFKFVYQKDSSVSRGDDCAYIDFVVIPAMTLTHAASYDDETEAKLTAWDYYYEAEYHFVPAMYDGGIALVSDNQGVHYSTATVFFTVQLEKDDVFTFEYIKDAEANWDKLTIASDIESVTIKPRSTTWQHYSVTAPQAGEYEFEVTFSKDGSVNVGTDTAYIRNVRIASATTLLNEALQLYYQGDDYLFQYEDGGCEIVHDGSGDYVTFTSSGDLTNAAIGALTQGIAFDYVTFKYKTEGNAGITFVVANYQYETQELIYTGDGEWEQFYYRIPKTHDDWLFVISADSDGGTVYLDDFYIGTLDADFDDALRIEGQEPIEYDYDYNFEGVYDPLESHGQTSYIRSRIPSGETATLRWATYFEPGDVLEIRIHFYEEELGSTESGYELYVNGEIAMDMDASWLDNEYWYRTTHSEDYRGWCSFELIYTSGAVSPGDAFAMQCGIIRACPLDEALNVEYGGIHFYEEEGDGNFIPRVDGDRAYAIPNPVSLTEEVNEYYCNFEAEDSLDGWVFIDSDGDGYNWRRLNVLNNDIHSDPLVDEYVLCCDDYRIVENAEEIELTPDDWALTPELTLPEGSGGFTVDFLFAASAPFYQGESFSVYVGSGTDVNTYTWVKDYVMTDEYWDYDALYIDRSMFSGDTVRVAFRHQYGGGVTGVMIDELSMTTDSLLHSEVSFDLNVNRGDAIAFELYCNVADPAYLEGRVVTLYAEGHGELLRINAYELAREYGIKTWIPVSVTVPFGGYETFRIIEEGNSSIYHGLYVYLDNVEILRTGSSVLPGDVDLDGRVTFSDVSALYMYMLGLSELSPEALANADFNGDGQINYVDITDLNMYLLSNG